MAQVTGVLCAVVTQGSEPDGGTDGSVFLGIGGREFRLDSSVDDFERGSYRVYVLGSAPAQSFLPWPEWWPQVAVSHPDRNDPALGLRLDTSVFNPLPKYLRLEGSDHWALCSAIAAVYAGDQFIIAYATPDSLRPHVWLGPTSGRVVHLTRRLRTANAVRGALDEHLTTTTGQV